MKTVVVTIDVEPDYPPYLENSSLGVEQGLPRILEVLSSNGIPANVFVLADLCRTHKSIAKDIVDRGFRLGSHSLHHRLLCRDDFQNQWRDVSESKRLLEEASGVKIRAFRAPGFGFDGDTLRCLEKAGFTIDSSILPGRRMRKRFIGHDYDFRGAPRLPYHPSREDVRKPGSSPVLEIPATENPIVPAVPIGGGFLHARGPAETFEAVSAVREDPVVMVLHPWEFVNLSEKFPKVPRWIKEACRSDVTPLSDFLNRARDAHWRFVALEDLASGEG